jgi:hypothetical protein
MEDNRKTYSQDAQKVRPARPQRVKQAEVEVKVELSRLLQSQPWPKPKPFRKLADFVSILRGPWNGVVRPRSHGCEAVEADDTSPGSRDLNSEKTKTLSL